MIGSMIGSYNLAQEKLLRCLIIWLALLATMFSMAQGNANTYYQQCLRFEVVGDYETAKQSCLNALQLQSGLSAASLALARIELQLGNSSAAERLLNQVRRDAPSAEAYLLLAEVALSDKRYDEAEAALGNARGYLADNYNNQIDGRLYQLAGRIAEARNQFQLALEHYQTAVMVDRLEPAYRVATADLYFRLSDLNAARAVLEDYQSFTGVTDHPEVLSILGHIKWSQGQLANAVADLENAVNPPREFVRSREAKTQDLQALTLIYYGQGNTRAGSLAFREVMRSGTSPLGYLLPFLPWFVLLVVLLGLHLWGESKMQPRSLTTEMESPILWKMGAVYSSLFLSLVGAAAVTFIFSILRYNNFLAIVTPIQQTDVRAVFLISLSLLLTGLSIWQVRKNGWEAGEKLFGSGEQLPLGILAGFGMLGATLAYLHFLPDIAFFGGFYLDLSRLTPLLIAAAVLLPLSELFFRAFVMPTLSKRYDSNLSLLISGSLSALVLGIPILLLLALGLAAAEVFRRTGSGVNALVAHLILNTGLVLGVAFIPWVKGLFV